MTERNYPWYNYAWAFLTCRTRWCIRPPCAFFVKELVCIGNSAVIKQETKYIAVWELILSAALQAVFLVIGKWDYKVLLGNLWSAPFAVLNFYLMCRTVEKTLQKGESDEKNARDYAKLSQTLRSFMLLGVAVIGAVVPVFSIWSALLPLLFPRIAAYLRVFFTRNEDTVNRGETHGE
ncbi:hypothetical protein SAMN02910447_00254 [Ruminococcus sp. YE71]|nr:hypothetical protein SAMN02910446_00095 [Ruminococcus sp. YE78]SFW12280.1 hypothetical protein SAMN02910447_00254 [Ruminococcus sp. YE71]